MEQRPVAISGKTITPTPHLMNKQNRIIEFLTTIKGWLLLATAQVVSMSGTGKGILALIIVFSLDFITGCWASWKEHRENPQPIRAYFIESAKIRKSGVKACGYMLFVFLAWVLTILYFDSVVHLPYSKKDLTVVQIVIGVCIATEAWSNVENFKRLGFDLVGTITNISKTVWGLFRTIKNGKDESNN
jgi:hypothetical protein